VTIAAARYFSTSSHPAVGVILGPPPMYVTQRGFSGSFAFAVPGNLSTRARSCVESIGHLTRWRWAACHAISSALASSRSVTSPKIHGSPKIHHGCQPPPVATITVGGWIA
jgi:hypothetical protein